MNKKNCRRCKAEFFTEKRGRIIFCSEICKMENMKENRRAYYNRNKDRLRSYQKKYQHEYRLSKLPVQKNCCCCGKKFINTKVKFCSDVCRKEKIKIDGRKRWHTDRYKESRRLWKLKNRDRENARKVKSRQREKKLIAFAEEILKQTGVMPWQI